jgi:hypothetical protein
LKHRGDDGDGDEDDDDDDDDGEDIESAIGPYWRQYKSIACFFLFFPLFAFCPNPSLKDG